MKKLIILLTMTLIISFAFNSYSMKCAPRNTNPIDKEQLQKLEQFALLAIDVMPHDPNTFVSISNEFTDCIGPDGDRNHISIVMGGKFTVRSPQKSPYGSFRDCLSIVKVSKIENFGDMSQVEAFVEYKIDVIQELICLQSAHNTHSGHSFPTVKGVFIPSQTER